MLRVMVVDEDNERRDILRQGLEQAGHRVVAQVHSTIQLPQLVAELKPDVIIIDTNSPDRDTLEHICVITQDAPRPIVMFSADGNMEKIREAVRAGVSAYVVDGLSAERVQPIIDVAIARFEELQALHNELASAQTQLADRKHIDKAKGILMKQKGLPEEEAYRMLRKMAMDRSLKLAEAAEQVIKAAKLLG
ncbi:MAG: ANTAR domain-containing protein [Betaproteobacteria bacterium]|nr:ANTAR domain-containing protein [Betaproteobacteria bacterium]